jgi:hypothetical protein
VETSGREKRTMTAKVFPREKMYLWMEGCKGRCEYYEQCITMHLFDHLWLKPTSTTYPKKTGWWFGTSFIFHSVGEFHHPNWSELHHFSEG